MVVEEGQLKGAFKGFKNRETIFEFYGGRKWKQAEYKYNYHYAYMPRAKVVQSGGRFILHVEGINPAYKYRSLLSCCIADLFRLKIGSDPLWLLLDRAQL